MYMVKLVDADGQPINNHVEICDSYKEAIHTGSAMYNDLGWPDGDWYEDYEDYLRDIDWMYAIGISVEQLHI